MNTKEHNQVILREGVERMPKGTVTWSSEEKGYGFISPDDGGENLFVHCTD